MKVILLQNVKKLGQKRDIKEVATGHAINCLIPCGMVSIADKHNLEILEIQKNKGSKSKKAKKK